MYTRPQSLLLGHFLHVRLACEYKQQNRSLPMDALRKKSCFICLQLLCHLLSIRLFSIALHADNRGRKVERQRGKKICGAETRKKGCGALLLLYNELVTSLK